MSWSGGKDCCLTLHALQTAGTPVAGLLTTLTRDYDRISTHGVRRILLERQAASLGLPLCQVSIPKDATNQAYEDAVSEALRHHHERGIRSVAFGDLFLEDVRAYREALLMRHDMNGVYPVWKRDTAQFVSKFIELGFRAVVTCVNGRVLPPSMAGMIIDERFLSMLPDHVDPCGENGEFHSFVFDGPNFAEPIAFSIGKTVPRNGFWYCDLLPADGADAYRGEEMRMPDARLTAREAGGVVGDPEAGHPARPSRKLVEGEDFYREGPFTVLTAAFHLRRGSCCGSGCRHCPYPKEA